MKNENESNIIQSKINENVAARRIAQYSAAYTYKP